ncbi:MAG: twin-arginine translocase TatA/TatE family subunit [Cyanobacteria bacterium J06598_1]
MFGLGIPEIVIIGVVAVLVFGPKRIPELGGALGKTLRGFKEEMDGDGEELDDDFEEEDP